MREIRIGDKVLFRKTSGKLGVMEVTHINDVGTMRFPKIHLRGINIETKKQIHSVPMRDVRRYIDGFNSSKYLKNDLLSNITPELLEQ